MNEKQKLLITGAGGRIGSKICDFLRHDFNLRLVDTKRIKNNSEDEIYHGDIRNVDLLKQVLDNVDAVLHLAAIPDEDDFYTKLVPYNIELPYTLFETARMMGVNKIIFASTCQTVLNYPNSQIITTQSPPRPYNLYACTKLFGESLARYFSDKFGMSIICLRIGWFQDYNSELLKDSEVQKRWCSPKDFAQLVTKSINSDLKYGVFFALSDNDNIYWDIKETKHMLQYKPVDGIKLKS